jgi:DNA-binding GntR family transcriptional regulator
MGIGYSRHPANQLPNGGRVSLTAKANEHRETTNLRESAYLHIQQKIVAGGLLPGGFVSELALAEELGISRTPIREALSRLTAEGILEQTPNRSTVVARLTRQDIIELYELREALEVYAVEKAARRSPSLAELNKLRELNVAILALKEELGRDGKRELNEEEMRRFLNYDLDTHMLFMRMAANARIQRVVNETRLLIRIFAMPRRGWTLELVESVYEHHAAIALAIAEQDVQAARQSISRHIQISMAERLAEFDSRELDASLQKYRDEML